MSDLVRYEVKDRVAVITIDNPPVNALAPAVWGDIDAAVARGVADPDAEALVLIGAGTTFIAGADIKAFELLKTPADSLARSATTHALLKRVEDASKPLVAAIHGNALGGGLEVAQACHFRVATKDARVGQPEVLLGIIPGAGGTQRLPRLIGLSRAKELIYSGRQVRAEEALAIGMADRIFPADEVYTAAVEDARVYANGPRVALAAAKHAIDSGMRADLRTGLRIERDDFVELFDTKDQKTGMRSLLENGPGKAEFEGK
jgi:enoyl-CoA hydratase/carnithine racemase